MELFRNSRKSVFLLAIGLAVSLFDGAAKGDDKNVGEPVAAGGQTVSPLSWEANADVSGIARSHFDGTQTSGKVETLDTVLGVTGTYQTTAGASLRVGLDYQRSNFGLPSGTPLPDGLQSFHLTLGTDLQLGSAWLVRFDLQPGFYGDQSGFRGRDLSCPMILGASYFVNSDLQLVGGISYDPDRKYPVLPGVGFRWKLAADWVVDAIFPTPRIEYTLTKSVMLYAGADLRGDTYRVSSDFGRKRGIPQLDNAVIDYSEVRVGAGASWKINSVLSMELESGCVLVDDFDFHRADIRARSIGAPPYGGISLKAAF